MMSDLLKITVAVSIILICTDLHAEEKVTIDEKFRASFDRSTDKGLAYLAKKQLPDGTFPSQRGSSTAISSLCIMAFLAKGYQPGLEPYGSVINRSIDFVLSHQQPNGLIDNGDRDSMYCHNISTLMLSEVSGMLDPERQKKVDVALSKAIKIILDAQKVAKGDVHKGGWRYYMNSSDSDLSMSGWALMALRSARNNGASVPKEAIDDAVKYIERNQASEGYAIYQSGNPPGGASYFAKTGAALLCLELCGKHRAPQCVRAQQYLQNKLNAYNNKPWGGVEGELFYYGLYYVAQGMYQFGGDEWEKFASQLYPIIFDIQSEDGSWDEKTRQKDRSEETAAGPCYKTAMAILALSVSYRQLPIYQR